MLYVSVALAGVTNLGFARRWIKGDKGFWVVWVLSTGFFGKLTSFWFYVCTGVYETIVDLGWLNDFTAGSLGFYYCFPGLDVF